MFHPITGAPLSGTPTEQKQQLDKACYEAQRIHHQQLHEATEKYPAVDFSNTFKWDPSQSTRNKICNLYNWVRYEYNGV